MNCWIQDATCAVKRTFNAETAQKKDKQKKKEARLSATAAKSASFAFVGQTLQAAIEPAKEQNAPECMNELLDSRCNVCRKTDFQCGNCAKKDKQKKKDARLSAAAARSASFAYVGQTLQAAIESAKEQNAPILQTAIESAKKVGKITNLRNVLKLAPHNWTLPHILRDGNCLFHSFVSAFNFLDGHDCQRQLPKTQKELRKACAQQLLDWNGKIPNYPDLFERDGPHNEMRLVQQYRGEKEEWVSISSFCKMLATSLYGGEEEIMLIVQMYKLQVWVYVDQDHRHEGGELKPKKYFMFPELPEDAEENRGPRIHLLLETAIEGAGDHTTHMIHKFQKHAYCMSRMPVIDKDYRVADCEYGRGLQSLKQPFIEVGDPCGKFFISLSSD